MTMRSGSASPAGTRITRMVRGRWRLLSLISAALLMITIGAALPSAPVFVLGLLVLGSATPDARPRTPTAAMVCAWAWLDERGARSR